MKINVFIAEDSENFADSLKQEILSDQDFEYKGRADNSTDLINKIGKVRPNILIQDLAMPEKKGSKIIKDMGLQLLPVLKARFPDLKIVILTSHAERKYIKKAKALGAEAYMLKSAGKEELFKAIKMVYQGASYFPEQDEPENHFAETKEAQIISKREIKILQLLKMDKSLEQIASDIGRKMSTIRLFIKILKLKLEVQNEFNLLSEAIRRKLI